MQKRHESFSKNLAGCKMVYDRNVSFFIKQEYDSTHGKVCLFFGEGNSLKRVKF